jgi:cytochrome c oxidase subunit 2
METQRATSAQCCHLSWRTIFGALGSIVTSALLSSCAGSPSALDPRGPAAAQVANLWWFLFGISMVVFVAVLSLLAYGLFRSRRRSPEGGLGDGRLFIGIGGAVIPAVILVVVMIVTVGVQGVVSAMPAKPAVTIEVTGYQWWWEVRYPDQGFTTANEIHIPAGQPVALKLTSADVIHSVWIPQLQVKTDTIPGTTNNLWIQADQPGVYRGECAEYCGLQHAHMAFVVVADPPEQFATWIANQQRPAADPTDPVLEQGKQVFMGSACVYCHTIRGIGASGQLGPDLTHMASRQTIGAGSLENNRGNLAGWIVNSQTIKPGNRMPPMYLDSTSLQALLTYLESLK